MEAIYAVALGLAVVVVEQIWQGIGHLKGGLQSGLTDIMSNPIIFSSSSSLGGAAW